MMTFTVNPSSYEPIIEGTTNAEYPEGCLRYQSVKHLLRALPRKELHPIYSAIGTMAEEYVAADNLGEFVSREVEIEVDLGDDVHAKGRADFISESSITEVKASVSASKRAMWRKGQISVGHWGQLASYLWLTDRNVGVLRAFYVHFFPMDDGTKVLRFEPYTFNLTRTTEMEETVRLYYKTVKNAMISDMLPPRPMTMRPCHTCPLSAVCANQPKDREAFFREVNVLIATGPKPVVGFGDPKIKTHRVRGDK